MHPHLDQVLSRLDRTRSSLESAVAAIEPSLLQIRPEQGRWSAAEVVEHLLLVERFFSGMLIASLEHAQSQGLGPETHAPECLPDPIETRLADRENRRTAPDRVQPSGTISIDISLAGISDVHSTLRHALCAADGLALCEVIVEHHVFGRLNAYQFVELIAGHEARHVQQVAETGKALAAS